MAPGTAAQFKVMFVDEKLPVSETGAVAGAAGRGRAATGVELLLVPPGPAAVTE
jgi:hypothetical protein